MAAFAVSEANLMREIQLAVSRTATRLFRNNVGKGWIGTVIQHSPHQVVIANPRRIEFGICTGSSDTIGWTPVMVTPEMVGATLAVFTAIEVKSRGKPLRKEQAAFGAAVEAAGGIFACAYSVEDALAAIARREWAAAQAVNASTANPLGQAGECPVDTANNPGSPAMREVPRRGEASAFASSHPQGPAPSPSS